MRDLIGELLLKLDDIMNRQSVREEKLDGEGIVAADEREESLSGIKVGHK